MTPDEYCQDKAAASGSSFYYSFLFLPPERRRAITALYAFCREIDDVVDECHDAQIAATKLAWWREELARVYAGNPQHPIGQALRPATERFNLPHELLSEIIDGMEMDLTQSRYLDFTALSLYCYRVASVVGLLAAEIFGYQDRHTQKYAHDLGMAFQLTNIIRDVGEDARRGRVYLPLDEMMQTVDYALNNGYTVCWDGDVSEKGFSFTNGVAINPEVKKVEDLSNTDRARFEKLGEKERLEEVFKFERPYPEINVTPEVRQAGFESFVTTDDHLMHLTGIAKDQNGTKYYITKNSWGTDRNKFGGYLNMSESFVRAKTIYVMVHKDAIPKAIKGKLHL